MIKKQHKHILGGHVEGHIEGHKQEQKTVFKAALLICAAVSMFSANYASAQSQVSDNVQDDQAIIATTTPDATTEQALPRDLEPEVLKAPRVRTLNPKDIKQQKRARSNRWNPQTLTQPTGLSAASQRSPQPIARPIMQADIMPTDLLSAQDLLKTSGVPTLRLVKPLEATTRSDGVINLSSSLRGALFDLSNTDNVNASVFKLDLGGQPCLGTAIECRANDNRRIDFGYAKNITKGKKNGFNLQLTPHGGLRVDDTGQSALVGALVRIGDNLREGSEMKSNTWYLFAGADAESLTYTPNSVRRLTSGEFHLQDRIIIGDAQAGVGYRLGDADLALTYYKRQAKAENYSYDENAAALSITWKR
ncbi:MAG: lipid A deacylase LpxR family protein [Robiginitomaculum sp.]|nr:lipid A deacylase LpxR family protein [Robiginitomaculum sp.]